MRWAIVTAGIFAATGALADDAGARPDVAVELRCPGSQGIGRVRCMVEAIPEGGRTISWADVVVVRTPPFATPLRGRLAPGDALDQASDRWRWEFALAARTRGRGDVTVRVRAVVCDHGACGAWQREVTAPLVVGE
ncbi:MAG TPA: hypothetical protein VGH28_28655 [Polyangiaceae bacterium]